MLSKLGEQFQLPLHNPVLIFSLVLFIILLAPILLNRIRIPGIIGLIVSGINSGPAALNILEKSLFVDRFFDYRTFIYYVYCRSGIGFERV